MILKNMVYLSLAYFSLILCLDRWKCKGPSLFAIRSKGQSRVESNMAHFFQKIDPLPLKPLKHKQAVKNRSNEDLIELVKKVLKTNIDLDFLLEINPRDREFLVACIRGRMDETNARV
jgi:hypothetical protein